MKHAFFLALLALAFAACSTASLQTLRQTPPPKDPYFAALSRHYLRFSDAQAALYDWNASQYFAEKGLKTAYGQDVEPEWPNAWPRFPKEQNTEAEELRKRLMAARTEANRHATPEVLADAMFGYDCWVEQNNGRGGGEEMELCRELLNDALYALEHPESKESDAAPVGNPDMKGAIPSLVLSDSYLLFFAWNSVHLSKSAVDVIHRLAKDTQGKGKVQLVLNGHTDTTGDTYYNMELSQRRADTVKAFLLKAGIPQSVISVFAFGESDQRVPTKDNVAEPANRRVEIFIE